MRIALYGLIAFAIVFGGGLLGLLLGKFLPEHHRSEETQKVVQTATGMVTLIAALVLGLLVASAKGKLDTNSQQTEEFAAKLMLVDRELVDFGPAADDARALLRKYTVAKIAATWPGEAGPKPAPGDPPPWRLLENFRQALAGLAPKTSEQRAEATAASETAAELERTSWLEAAEASAHVQQPFVVLLVLWLFVLFVSIGLFAPRNAMAVAALLVGAFAVSGAILLIVDMDAPYEGLIVVSPEPMQQALAQISAP